MDDENKKAVEYLLVLHPTTRCPCLTRLSGVVGCEGVAVSGEKSQMEPTRPLVATNTA